MVSLGCWFDTWFIRVLFFFFKQKTAYEMRISDWSSDVCSSDLTVIRYRGKSAVRDVAKAFGLPPDQVALLAECHGWGNGETPMEQRLREAGFDIDNPLIARVLAVTDMLRGRPRHLSQHVGGFVISDQPLWQLVPVENAAMDERTIIQWEKEDRKPSGILPIDSLCLGRT